MGSVHTHKNSHPQITLTSSGPGYELGSFRFVDLPFVGQTYKQANGITLTFSDGTSQRFPIPGRKSWWDFSLVPVTTTTVQVGDFAELLFPEWVMGQTRP